MNGRTSLTTSLSPQSQALKLQPLGYFALLWNGEALCSQKLLLFFFLCFLASLAVSDELIKFVLSLLKEFQGLSLFFPPVFFSALIEPNVICMLNWEHKIEWKYVEGVGGARQTRGEKRLKGGSAAEGRKNWKRCLAKWREMLNEQSSLVYVGTLWFTRSLQHFAHS